MKSSIRVLTIVMFLLSTLAAGVAYGTESGWYLSADVGYQVSTDTAEYTGPSTRLTTAREPDADLDSSTIWGVALGFDHGNGLKTEIEVRRRKINLDNASVSVPLRSEIDSANGGILSSNSVSTERFQYGGAGKVFNISAVANYQLFEWKMLAPYVRGGLGYADIHLDPDLTIDPTFSLIGSSNVLGEPNTINYEGNQAHFTWSVGFGIDIQPPLELGQSRAPSLSIEYQYADFGDAQTAVDSSGDQIDFGHLNTHEVTLGVNIPL